MAARAREYAFPLAVCVEMQNGHGTPQGEVYREALLLFPSSSFFPFFLFFIFWGRRGGFCPARR